MRPGRRDLFTVERERRWRIWLLFALQLGCVFAVVWVMCALAGLLLVLLAPTVASLDWLVSARVMGVVFGLTLFLAALQWAGVVFGAKRRLLRAMHCIPLDPGDRYHQRLANVVEELRPATGSPRVECVTVPTLGMNAFAFSDLRGSGVVGVTEGALARLSRQQLQAVVAHEFAHILSGTWVTVTVSCLLFGIYSQLEEAVQAAAEDAGEGGNAAPAAIAVLLAVPLLLLKLAAVVTSAALSRERDRAADLAAVRFTRDPLSLAEALRTIGRHPDGAGYIPDGLAPLCIRGAHEDGVGRLRAWGDVHLPLAERVGSLIVLANATPDEFDRQLDESAQRFAAREHWAPAPAPAAATAADVPTGAAPAGAAPAAGPGSCPACGHGLEPADYEGVRLRACPSCGGRLLRAGDVGRVLARRETGFSDEQVRLADLLVAEGDRLRLAALQRRGSRAVVHIPCPSCGELMLRALYDYQHAVEVDRCLICGLTWFDRDELEALQLMAERQID